MSTRVMTATGTYRMPGELFLKFLDTAIKDSVIEFVIQGETVRVGAKKEASPEVVIRVSDPKFLDEVLSYGNLALGEAFMNQAFDIDGDDVAGFIGVLIRNKVDAGLRRRVGLTMAAKMAWIRLRNRIRGRHGNVHHHFDIGNDLYEAFLDPTLAYTCGYVVNPDDTLEEIQENKYKRICKKLDVQQGDRLADIGCGFGGLLIYTAKNYGITGKGVTISKKQFEKANERIAEEGLSDKIRVEYASYEELTGSYDKIVSVGMMEHLRNSEYPRCIRGISEMLAPHGRGLIHFIGCPSSHRDAFTQKYLFPGAQWPNLSLIIEQLERHELGVLDVENMIRHYTVTLQLWLEKFRENYSTLDPERYNETFRRMWEYYLGISIAASLVSDVALYQVVITKDFAAPIPYQRV